MAAVRFRQHHIHYSRCEYTHPALKSDKETYVDDSSLAFNTSDDTVASFLFCPTCSEDDKACKLFDQFDLMRSRAYAGSGIDIRRLIRKARAGEPIHMAVIGGSVSSCRGVDEESECYHSLIFQWWNSTFPHPDNKLTNLARAGTGSNYFSYCWPNFLASDFDLAIIELAVNDIEISQNVTRHYEMLVRSILQQPHKPVIMLMSMFSRHLMNRWAWQDATELHLPVANYYDIPLISLKNVLYQKVISQSVEESGYFLEDWHHISAKGHKAAATLLFAYVQSEACRLEEFYKLDQISERTIPPISLLTLPAHADSFQDSKPMCAVAGDEVNPLKPKAGTGKDWNFYEWSSDKRYLVSDTVGASISFDIVTSGGTVVVDPFRSKDYGLGNALCWIDDMKDKGVELVGYWNQRWNVGIPVEIAIRLAPGNHSVTCEILEKTDNPDGGHHFRIIAVMTS